MEKPTPSAWRTVHCIVHCRLCKIQFSCKCNRGELMSSLIIRWKFSDTRRSLESIARWLLTTILKAEILEPVQIPQFTQQATCKFRGVNFSWICKWSLIVDWWNWDPHSCCLSCVVLSFISKLRSPAMAAAIRVGLQKWTVPVLPPGSPKLEVLGHQMKCIQPAPLLDPLKLTIDHQMPTDPFTSFVCMGMLINHLYADAICKCKGAPM